MPGQNFAPPPNLRVGIVPVDNFTMLAFAGFIDTLRLAADEGDRSRPVRCTWQVLSEDRLPVRASNGVYVQAQSGLIDPSGFDYLVVVGGTLHDRPSETLALREYLRRAAAHKVPLVGLCTGSLTLARAGLMEGRRACVSWFHHDDYLAEFPRHAVVSDRLFLDDGDRITCAGGVSVVHLASHLVERHCGARVAEKGLRIMIEEPELPGSAPQPAPGVLALTPTTDPRVRRALIAMERRIAEPLALTDLAAIVGTTPRHLSRLFRDALGDSPGNVLRQLRLDRAKHLLSTGRPKLADVAAECGFVDSSHLGRSYRRAFGVNPGRGRRVQRRPSAK